MHLLRKTSTYIGAALHFLAYPFGRIICEDDDAYFVASSAAEAWLFFSSSKAQRYEFGLYGWNLVR